MKFQRKKVATALAFMMGVGGAVTLAGPAFAQDIRVDVTGSNIKRVEGEGALPVQVITRKEIENTNVQTAADILDKIAANQSFGSWNDSGGVGSSYTGFTGASLRGLGTSRTLVLLNGKRIAPYAQADASGIDLNSIPIGAIERIEILKDGASAIYGADAVAGVINFILRNDYQGYEAYGYYGDTTQGGAMTWSASFLAGWGDLTKDKWNAYFSVAYFDQEELKATSRSFSRTAYRPDLGLDNTSGNATPGNIGAPFTSGGTLVPGGTRNPANPACSPPLSFPTQGSPRQCRFDYAATINIWPPSEKWNLLGKATWQLNPDTQLFLEGTYYQANYTYAVSPTPISSAIDPRGRITLMPSSQYYPAAFVTSIGGDPSQPLNVLWRAAELGPRTEELESTQYRVVGGVTGTYKGWDYALAGRYNQNEQDTKYTNGYLSYERLMPLLNSGRVNFFGPNTPEVAAEMAAAKIIAPVQNAKAVDYGIDGKISNEIYKMPAGPLSMALGFDIHKEELSQTNFPVYSSGDTIGGAGTIPSLPKVDRDVYSVFAEFNIPIIKNLEANIAVRYDDYSDFGSTTNPKISLRYQPTKEVLFRGAWGTGYRAPTLADLFQPPLITNTAGAFDDPLRCPTTQAAEDCNIQFNAQQGGNAFLQAEESTQWFVGAVWDPSPNVTMGIDYYNISIDKALASLSADTIFSDYNQYQQYVVRRPPAPPYPNLPGEINYVIETTANLTRQSTTGIDVDFTGRADTGVGRFTFSMNGNYVLSYKQSSIGDDTLVEYVGTRGASGAISRWKHFLSLDWTQGAWGTTLSQSFQDGYSEPDYLSDDADATRRVGAYSLWNLQGRYTGFKNMTLTLGMQNLFDTDPPASNQNDSFQVGYDLRYADPRGRFYYGSIRYAFK